MLYGVRGVWIVELRDVEWVMCCCYEGNVGMIFSNDVMGGVEEVFKEFVKVNKINVWMFVIFRRYKCCVKLF